MRKILTSLICTLFVVAPLSTEVASAADQAKNDDRLRNGTVLKQILDVPGRKIPVSDIVLSRHVAIPPAARQTISTLGAKTPVRKRQAIGRRCDLATH